tara:strand:- start:482 stop:754 length:273 start_codon:yes stop_codon:yes gene_type:complete
MKLEVLRFSSQKDSTNGLLFDTTDGRNFLAYTLEDEKRENKVMHETRVPAGTYKIKLRTVGGFMEDMLKNMVQCIKVCYMYKMYLDLNIF